MTKTISVTLSDEQAREWETFSQLANIDAGDLDKAASDFLTKELIGYSGILLTARGVGMDFDNEITAAKESLIEEYNISPALANQLAKDYVSMLQVYLLFSNQVDKSGMAIFARAVGRELAKLPKIEDD